MASSLIFLKETSLEQSLRAPKSQLKPTLNKYVSSGCEVCSTAHRSAVFIPEKHSQMDKMPTVYMILKI